METLEYLFCPECGSRNFDTRGWSRGWSNWNPHTGVFEIYEVEEHYCTDCDTNFYNYIQKMIVCDKIFKVL